MLQLEFWHEKDEYAVGYIAAIVGQPIPSVGDSADVPDAVEAGKYAYVKVTRRQFYYGLKGDLPRVRLYCVTL